MSISQRIRDLQSSPELTPEAADLLAAALVAHEEKAPLLSFRKDCRFCEGTGWRTFVLGPAKSTVSCLYCRPS